MTKEEQIKAKSLKPIEVGDTVKVSIDYKKRVSKPILVGKKKKYVEEEIDSNFLLEGEVIKIHDDKIDVANNNTSLPTELYNIIESYYPERYSHVFIVDKKYVSPTYSECGANPFGRIKRRISFYNQDLVSILFKAGYGHRDNNFKEQNLDRDNRVNFNPFIIDSNGERKYYQRDLVWTLEQKQLLIDSIYNDIEIGKFLFRYNSWARMQKEKEETGLMHSFDCVDGKQRFFAILEFLQNKFKDKNDFYWDDLSADAQRRFLAYGNLSYGELPESATDEDVIDNFLTLNHTGTPMSLEHIEYVKSLNLK